MTGGKNNNGPSNSKIEFVCQFTLLKELQSIVAFYAYEQVKVNGASMKISDLHQTVFDRYHGTGPDSISLVEKFLHGEEMFKGIYDDSHDVVTGRSQSVLKPGLHCQSGKELVLDPDPRLKGTNMITMTCSKLTDSKPLSGRTIWEMGKRVAEHGRKMLAIVLQSKYKDGTLPSGAEWEDYLKFCRYNMMMAYGPQKGNECLSNSNAADAETEDELLKDWESQWSFPGFMAWALWGHIPMPGIDNEYRAQCFMMGDDHVIIANRKSRGRAASRHENQSMVLPKATVRATNPPAVCVKEQLLYAEYHNAKRFRRSMIDLGQLEMEMKSLDSSYEHANRQVMEYRDFVMSKSDLFDNPEKYKDWHPYQQWKAAIDARNAISKEIELLRQQTRERRRLNALESEQDEVDAVTLLPPQHPVPVKNILVLSDDDLTLTTNTTGSTTGTTATGNKGAGDDK